MDAALPRGKVFKVGGKKKIRKKKSVNILGRGKRKSEERSSINNTCHAPLISNAVSLKYCRLVPVYNLDSIFMNDVLNTFGQFAAC